MKKTLLGAGLVALFATLVVVALPARATAPAAVDLSGLPLHDGDVITANQSSGDPDVFIIKLWPHGDYNGYKRLFLNPVIFSFYGHLGGFARVRQVTAVVRDSFETSGLFRDCETNEQDVWATEVTGEDTGTLHHVQMTGDQAVAEDPAFFLRVFCINSREEAWYTKSLTPYYHLSEIPVYFRQACQVRPACLDTTPRCLIPEPIGGWCPSPTPTVFPTPPLACGRACNTSSDCASGLTCYQPPFYCPPGQYCAQVMPPKICRSAANPDDPMCSAPVPTATPVTSASIILSDQNDGQNYHVGGYLPVAWTALGIQQGDQVYVTVWLGSSSISLGSYPASDGSASAYLMSSSFWQNSASYHLSVSLQRPTSGGGTTTLATDDETGTFRVTVY